MDINAEIIELDREISRAGMLQAQCDIDSGTYWYYEGRTQALLYMRDRLIHQRPEVDSWSRLEEDAKLSLCEYNLRHKPAAGDGTTLGEDVRVDLVRRCRALAERERGE